MSQPSPETREILNWIITEISAGKVLFPKSLDEQAWNNASERAIQIIRNYNDGCGLFQMTRKSKVDAMQALSDEPLSKSAKKQPRKGR